MARVLICEPHDDVSALLQLVVRRLGHEAVTWTGSDSELDGVCVGVIEPGETAGLRLAGRLRDIGIPVLFTSIFPADDSTLAYEPAAYLVKPFPLYTLERAIVDALDPCPAVVAG